MTRRSTWRTTIARTPGSTFCAYGRGAGDHNRQRLTPLRTGAFQRRNPTRTRLAAPALVALGRLEACDWASADDLFGAIEPLCRHGLTYCSCPAPTIPWSADVQPGANNSCGAE